MIEELSNEELQQIFDLLPKNEKVGQIIKKEKDEESRFILREHAFALYWKRHLDSLRRLTDRDIRLIISDYSEFPVSEGILGDAARMGLLSLSQCCELLEIIRDKWAYKAISARILLYDVIAVIAETDIHTNDNTNIIKVADELIRQKMGWAVLELVSYLRPEELADLRHRMEDKSVLTRWDRHLVREKIDRIIKNKKVKSR